MHSTDTNLAKRKINEIGIVFLQGELDISPRVSIGKCVTASGLEETWPAEVSTGLGKRAPWGKHHTHEIRKTASEHEER